MSREDEEGVLGPEELDIERSERAARLDDGRFVIAADADESPDPPDPVEPTEEPDEGGSTSALERVQAAETAHGFVVAATFDGASSETSVFADDLGQVFRSLLLWYAAGVDPSSPPEEVLGVLLRASGLTVRYPPGTLARLVASHGLTPEDDIADLLDAVAEAGVNVE